MSLRAFHIFFIVASILMSLLVGGWGVWDYRRSGSTTHLGLGIGSFVAAAVLIWYSTWFVRKRRLADSARP